MKNILTLFCFLVFATPFLLAQEVLFEENFDCGTKPGWQYGAKGINGGVDNRCSWMIGIPHGAYGLDKLKNELGNPDPTIDHTASNALNCVAGQGLMPFSKIEGQGTYYGKSDEWLISPAINCSNFTESNLKFWRWANFGDKEDDCFIEISNDSINWYKLPHPKNPREKQWVEVSVDISYYADRKNKVYLKWRSKTNKSVLYSGWNIDDIQVSGNNIVNVGWTGSVSSNWSNPANWGMSRLPDTTSNITISASVANMPVMSSCSYSIKSITLAPGASLQINSNASLNVLGNLLLKASNTQVASILDLGILNVTGTSTVQTWVPSKLWTLVSSPVNNATRSLFYNFSYYSEVASASNIRYAWKKVLPETNYTMQPLAGYNVYNINNGIINYTGKLNKGLFTINCNYSQGIEKDVNKGWNLIGNPYPSYIDWESNAIVKNNLNDAIYVWNPTTKSYSSYVDGIGINGGSQYIAPTVGFFVKAANQGTGYITINDNARLVRIPSTFKSTNPSSMILKIRIASSAYTDETVLRFETSASEDFDPTNDAQKMFSSYTEVPQIFTNLSSGMSMAINTLPSIMGETIIPLHTQANITGNYSLHFDGLDAFYDGGNIVLEDMLSGTITDLKQINNYNYSFGTGESENRFVLRIGGADLTTKVEELKKSDASIYSYENLLYINTNESSLIQILDITGRTILNTEVNGKTEIELKSGIYIVNISNASQVISRKIIIK